MAQRRKAGPRVVVGALVMLALGAGACGDKEVPQPTRQPEMKEGTGGSGPAGEGGTAGGGGIGSGASLNDRRPDLTGQDATQDLKAQPGGNAEEAQQLEEARQPARKIGEGERKPASVPGQ